MKNDTSNIIDEETCNNYKELAISILNWTSNFLKISVNKVVYNSVEVIYIYIFYY
jgi:hypothetical protein